MDQLWAIRKDFDPFPARVFINYNPLAIFRCTAYLCPYCSGPFKLAWGQEVVFVGSGERSCWRCGKIFWDNSQEWPEMSSKDQRLFLLPISVAGWLGGTLIVGAIAIYAAYAARSGVQLVAGLFVLLFLLIPLMIWFGFRWFQILRSVRRYNQRVSVKPL
jgi:hypothetical protein